MPRTDEGDDVIFNLGTAQTIRSFGAQKQGQKIIGHIFALIHARFSQRNGIGDKFTEEAKRLVTTKAREARQPVRQAKQIKRINAAHRFKKLVDLVRKIIGITGNFAREQRFSQNVIGEQRPVSHGARKAADMTRSENRRHRLA